LASRLIAVLFPLTEQLARFSSVRVTRRVIGVHAFHQLAVSLERHGNLLFPRGDVEGCLREHRRSLDLAREAGSAELEAAALGGLGDAERSLM